MSELYVPTADEAMNWATITAGEGLTDQMVADLYAATASEQMIPLTQEKLAEHPVGVAVSHLGRIAGYTGITSEYALTDEQGQRHRALEVGGAVVMPEFRRRGLASAMLHNLIDTVQESKEYPGGTRLVAFTNLKSRGYIEKAGMYPLRDGERLSTDAFALCRDCTSCPTNGAMPWEDPQKCCDYSGIRALEIE